MSDIIFQSTYDNIKEFIKGKNVEDLMELSTYIVGTEAINRPPNELEKQFIKEFFTTEAWAEHIQYQKGTQKGKYFLKIPPFDLQTISKILFFEVMELAKEEMTSIKRDLSTLDLENQIKDNEKMLLEAELRVAVVKSHDENGVFWKDDGWCNISEVLQKYGLISL